MSQTQAATQPAGPRHARHLGDRLRPGPATKWKTSCERARSNVPSSNGQRLGRADADVGARDARAACLDERLRGIDAGDAVGADDLREDGGQRARAAADVEHVLARGDAGRARELVRERGRL